MFTHFKNQAHCRYRRTEYLAFPMMQVMMVMVTDKGDAVDLYDNNDSDVDDIDDVDDVGDDDTDFDVELMISFSPALSIVHSLNFCDCSCDGGGSSS